MLPVNRPTSYKRAHSGAARLTLAASLIALSAVSSPLGAAEYCESRRALDDSCADNGFALGGLFSSSQTDTKPALWTGLYLGADLGGALGSVATHGLTSGDIDSAGLTGSIHAGYSILWDNILLGVEFDITRSGLDGHRRFPGATEITSDINWLSSSRLRLGYATGDYLFYATGGLAYGRQELQFSSPAIDISNDDALFGYAVGGGIEMKLSDSLSARVEAIHYGFGDQTFDISNQQLETDTDLTTIRAGLTMHFN